MALLSDVHANLPAFEAVLADIRATSVDAVWCLGDLVGYGAQPDECVALAREACDACLVGNHDLVVIGQLDIGDFSRHAAEAARWTAGRIGEQARDFLAGLEPADTSRSIGLFHASPRDPVWEYVLSASQAGACFRSMEHRIGAVGHSHVAPWFHDDGEGGFPSGDQARAGDRADLSEGRWLLNPGGVGQPRDGDARAAWLLLDQRQATATWHRVDYPIDQAAEAIRAAGVPSVLADRLYVGQ